MCRAKTTLPQTFIIALTPSYPTIDGHEVTCIYFWRANFLTCMIHTCDLYYPPVRPMQRTWSADSFDLCDMCDQHDPCVTHVIYVTFLEDMVFDLPVRYLPSGLPYIYLAGRGLTGRYVAKRPPIRRLGSYMFPSFLASNIPDRYLACENVRLAPWSGCQGMSRPVQILSHVFIKAKPDSGSRLLAPLWVRENIAKQKLFTCWHCPFLSFLLLTALDRGN